MTQKPYHRSFFFLKLNTSTFSPTTYIIVPWTIDCENEAISYVRYFCLPAWYRAQIIINLITRGIGPRNSVLLTVSYERSNKSQKSQNDRTGCCSACLFVSLTRKGFVSSYWIGILPSNRICESSALSIVILFQTLLY